MPADPRAVLTRPARPPDHQLRYGPGPEQVADLYLPASAASPGRPLVLALHGGFWRAGYDRRHLGPLAEDLTRHGYPVLLVEYRRTGQPGGGWPGTFEDVALAVDTLPVLAAPLLPDPAAANRWLALGHSAGGHLVLWLTLRHCLPAGETGLAGVLALAPVANLGLAHQLGLGGGAVRDLLGGGPAEVPERFAVADPCRLAQPRLAAPRCAPVEVVHGALDEVVPPEVGVFPGARATLLAGVEHFGVIDPEAPVAWPAVLAALRRLAG